MLNSRKVQSSLANANWSCALGCSASSSPMVRFCSKGGRHVSRVMGLEGRRLVTSTLFHANHSSVLRYSQIVWKILFFDSPDRDVNHVENQLSSLCTHRNDKMTFDQMGSNIK